MEMAEVCAKFDSETRISLAQRKLPLPQVIEKLYFKRFGKTAPNTVMSIEDRARLEQQKKEAHRHAWR
jgi:hypothetical protein